MPSLPDHLNFWAVLLTMLAGGITGGTVNFFFDPNPPTVNSQPQANKSATGLGSGPITRLPSVLAHQPSYYWRCVVVGIGAALLVPVFLFLIRSRLLDDLLDTQSFSAQTVKVAKPSTASATKPSLADSTVTYPVATSDTAQRIVDRSATPAAKDSLAPATREGSFLVFFSLCVLVAISGFRFIPSITDRFLQLEKKADQAKSEAQQAVAQATVTGQVAEQNRELLAQTKQTAESQEDAFRQLINKTVNVSASTGLLMEAQPPSRGVASSQTPERDQLIAERLALPDKFPNADDPQKGRWGAHAISAHYRLKADITPLDRFGRYCEVVIRVEAIDPTQHPLLGEVVFFVHPTFGEARKNTPVENGQATLSLWAYGVFTVGAVTEDAEMMELDLAEVVANDPRISDDFRRS